MPFNQPLTLKVADESVFAVPLLLVVILSMLSAVLSPYPVGLSLFIFLLCAAAWKFDILGIYNTNNADVISVIHPDGRVGVKSGHQDMFEGFLEDQNWCTRGLAVLRITRGKKTTRLVILAIQQDNGDDFRRLNMWLRQDFCRETRHQRVPLMPSAK